MGKALEAIITANCTAASKRKITVLNCLAWQFAQIHTYILFLLLFNPAALQIHNNTMIENNNNNNILAVGPRPALGPFT
jgi:hypothetical protein